jgi:Mlc titration factor MtfA (ptsG expression regulator)
MVIVVLLLIVLVSLTLRLVLIVIFTVLEEMYMHAFKRPFFIHFYPQKRLLTPSQESVLRQEFPFYNSLSEKRQSYFQHRTAQFIAHHEFIGKEDFIVTDQVKVLVAATSTMLTFGMRKYLFPVVNTVIIYPEAYFSSVSNEYHKGEFNPRVKAIVFSWEDFLEGYKIGNDNLNLGIHEFSHVVHYHGSRYEDSSAIIFSRMYKNITAWFDKPGTRDQLVNSNYFRVYAYTNQYEFIAVLIEHYFETPQIFQKEFPELYRKVSLMLNHQHAQNESQGLESTQSF